MSQMVGFYIVEEVEVRDQWKEQFEELYGDADRPGHQTLFR